MRSRRGLSSRSAWAAPTSPPQAAISPDPSFSASRVKPMAASSSGRGIVCEPIERVGLGLEARDVFLLSAWISSHYVPLSPDLDRLGGERDFCCWFGHPPQHALNFRRFHLLCVPKTSSVLIR